MSRPADETIRQQAQELFLGRVPVLGVGLALDEGLLKLSFLFSHKSDLEREIIRWAAGQGVEAQITVVGAPILTGEVAS